MIRGEGYSNSHTCDGDSGSPYFFYRSVGENVDFLPMVFAVHYGRNETSNIMSGNLVERELNWIESKIRSESPYPIETFVFDSYWKRTAYLEKLFPAVIKGPGGKCLDVEGARTDPGTPVQLYICNGTVAQKWVIYPQGLIYYRDGLCLDAGTGENGVQFTVQACSETNSFQKFAIQRTGAIAGPGPTPAYLLPLCVSSRNASTEDRTPVEFQTCFGGQWQTWNWSERW
ncbi:hypothetical protein CH373_12545 [Leptospira perolatii]|nr:hypothetical protein CH373_12545 [Leptospira perolatii]